MRGTISRLFDASAEPQLQKLNNNTEDLNCSMKPTNLCVHEHYLILENLDNTCPCKELNPKHMKNKLILIVCISLELLE